MESKSDGVVHKEVTRANRQEHIGVAIDCPHPTVHVSGIGIGSSASSIGEQHVKAIDRFTGSGLNKLGKHGLHQDLLLRCTEGNNNVVMDVEAQGMEPEEERHPAQVANDRFLVLEHPSQDVVLIGFGVVITNEEDRTVSEGTAHQSDGDVLVVGVKRCRGCVVLRDEGIRRHRIHVLRHQTGHHAKRGEGQAQLEVKAVVDGVVQAFMASTQVPRSALGGIVGLEDLLNGVTNTEIGAVHVTGNHE